MLALQTEIIMIIIQIELLKVHLNKALNVIKFQNV